jgi:AcrR family transcriptional regulator
MELQPAAQRREQQRQDARRSILAGAEALILESGFERFSIRRLAARCGYTAPTIYHHFGDKNGLVDTLLNERFQEILVRMRRVPQRRDRVRYLRELGHEFVRFMLDNRTHYQLLTIPRHESPAELLPAAEEAQRLVQRAFRERAEQGRLATRDLEAAFQSLWVLLHGLVSAQIMRPDYPWSPRLVDVALDAWEGGMTREGDG